MKQKASTARRNLAILVSLLFCLSLIGSSTQPLSAESSTAESESVVDITFVVNRVDDISDRNIGDGKCDFSVNIGDQCTLRAAIEELNSGDPSQTYRIDFDISGTGPFTIAPNSPLPEIEGQAIIDGSSQDGASCPTDETPASLLIVLDGSNMIGNATRGFDFLTGSDSSQVKGMVIGNFSGAAIRIDSDVVTVWCSHIGIGADGVSPMPNGLYGVRVQGEGNVIGFDADSSRNVISNNGLNAIRLEGNDNFVYSNYIGTHATGTGAAGNGFDFPNAGGGIMISGDNNRVGAERDDDGNVIGNSDGFGIRIDSSANNLIEGNYIGIAEDGETPLPNSKQGVVLFASAQGNTIGGTIPTDGNVIAHNGGNGIETTSEPGLLNPLNTKIRGNDIHSNGELGIDILADGVTTAGVPLLEPGLGGANVFIGLAGDPNTTYDIELFISQNCDPSNFGEGQFYWTQVPVTTTAGGTTNHTLPIPANVPGGSAITATSTGNATSEFSECLIVPNNETPTITPTITPTNTPTATVTLTPTVTVTPTVTPTVIPTMTVTVDPNVTVTVVPTVTVAPTMTITAEVPTDMPTATSTPSPVTPTPMTPTPTSTGTITPSATPTAIDEGKGDGNGDGQGQGEGFNGKVYAPVVNN